MRNYRSVAGLTLTALAVVSLAGWAWARAESAAPSAAAPTETAAPAPATTTAAPAPAATVVTIKTSDGKGADTLVDTWKPDENFGAARSAGLKCDNTGGRKLYLRFDLSSVKDPIKGATLELAVVSGTRGFLTYNVFGVVNGDDDNWAEGTGGATAAPAAKGKGKGKGKAAAPAATPAAATDTGTAATPAATAATASAAPAATAGTETAAPVKPAADGITGETAPVASKSAGGKYDPAKKTGGGVDNAKTVFLGMFSLSNEGYALSKKKGTVAFGSQELVDFLGKDANKLVTLILTRESADRTTWVDFGTKEGGNPATLKVSAEAMPFPVQPIPPAAPAKPAATGAPATATATAPAPAPAAATATN